jgi:hypothetical protein
MRTLLALAFLSVIISNANGQDAAAIAAQQAQQASQQAQQANQQAIQAAQQAQQQAQLAAQQAAIDDAPTNFPTCCAPTMRPAFSVKAGTYDKTLLVKITDKTRGSEIFYTTDGWTPTLKSPRYEGPIPIDKTTKLQAIAVGPYSARSLVASAQYTILTPGAEKAAASAQSDAKTEAKKDGETSSPLQGEQQNRDDRPPVISVDRLNATPTQDAATKPAEASAASVPAEAVVLPERTEVHLVFAADVSSKTAEVGDKILFTLAEDIKTDDGVIVPKGATAEGVVTQAIKTGVIGAPGEVSFRVKTLNANGSVVPLRGSATLEGDAHPPNAAFLIPVVGELSALRHGTDAEIKKGTPMTAYVAVDTPVVPGMATSPAN